VVGDAVGQPLTAAEAVNVADGLRAVVAALSAPTPRDRHLAALLGEAAARVEHHPRWGGGCWIINSWGSWGVGVPELGLTTGCAFLQDASLAVLLADQGESTCARDLYVAPAVFFAPRGSAVFHTARHFLIRHDRSFTSYAAALAAGLRPCRLCRPKP